MRKPRPTYNIPRTYDDYVCGHDPDLEYQEEND